MTPAFEEKIKMIDTFISKAEEILKKEDLESASLYINQVMGVYASEIPELAGGLNIYKYVPDEDGSKSYQDVELLKLKLKNYKLNLKTGLYFKLFGEENGNTISVTQNSNQRIESSVVISFDQVVSNINEISESVLSEQDKEILEGKLANLASEKDKGKKKEKAGDILKWIAERGIDVGIATLPYFLQLLGI